MGLRLTWWGDAAGRIQAAVGDFAVLQQRMAGFLAQFERRGLTWQGPHGASFKLRIVNL